VYRVALTGDNCTGHLVFGCFRTANGYSDSMRASRDSLQADAVDALTDALTQAGLQVRPETPDGPGGPFLIVEGPNRSMTLQVKAASVADPGRVNAMLQDSARQRGSQSPVDAVVLVADEVSKASRDLLRDRGWGYLDRRGRLWLRTEDLIINDTEIEPRPRHRSEDAPTDPLGGRIAMGMSLWILMHPEKPIGVRALARELDCSPSTAHDALKRLQAIALVRPDNTPLIPELFWAVADRWRPERHYVGREPNPDDTSSLGFGWPGLDFVISNDVAAAAWGAPVVVRSRHSLDFYVPPAVLNRAVRLLGPAGATDGAATLSAAPIRALSEEAIDHRSRSTPWLRWPLSHPAVVALDLAQDRSRGREILAGWDAPQGFIRVW
jgi:hypothetical protein